MRSAAEVAIMLSDIYETAFGGKERGRYRISRSNLKQLSDRRVLRQSFVDELKEEIWEYELVVVELEDGFALIDMNLLDGYRYVPRAVIQEAAEAFDEEYGEDEGEDEDDEEEDYEEEDDDEEDDDYEEDEDEEEEGEDEAPK